MANGTQPVVKISGYLEKKAKLRIGSPWKKYWFVLEGRLLLYYRSKDEYEALSPCKGSINLCPPCNVKPALSAACVFQIECRASTVTLRAENRHEQERWMQALLAAIAQSKSSPNRMSHFRYSLDDLPVPTKENKKSEPILSRQNTMPHRISSLPKKGTKEIIERLQQMGAQTYGGSLGTITKLANKEYQDSNTNSPKLPEKHTNSSQDNSSIGSEDSKSGERRSLKLSQSTERIQNLHYDNEQYSIIQEENSIEMFLDQQLCKEVNKEKIKSVLVDNDQYIETLELAENKQQSEINKIEKLIRKTSFVVENDQYCRNSKSESEDDQYLRNKEQYKVEHLYERISSDSTISESNTEHIRNKITEGSGKIKQSINLYERISGSSSSSDIQTKLNEQYSTVLKDSKQTEKNTLKVESSQDANRLSEHEYSLPINFKDDSTDHNENTLLVENDHYIPTTDDKSKENPYANGLIYTTEYAEYDAIDKVKEQEELYEDPDKLKKQQPVFYHEIEPALPPRHDSKKHESSEETSSQTSSNDGVNKRKNSRFRKLTQFVKHEKKSDSNSDVCKTKPKKRSTSFIRRVWRRKAKSLDEEEITYETVDYEVIEKQETKDRTDIQMLQELQKILETRKAMLQEKLNPSENKTDISKSQGAESHVQPIVEEKEEEPVEIRSEEAIDERRPSLPPRQSSPIHDIPQDNKISSQTTDKLIKNMDDNCNNNNEENNSNENVKTIDEILEDLDKEKNIQESRQKVKQLIEKFNDFQGEEDVVLRKKSEFNVCKSQSDTTVAQIVNVDIPAADTSRESDELSKLLEELSKVTCAPILTPGVTSSLVTPVLTDDEWLQLIPIRRRRLSEPDYDVPRPHRSLQLHNRNKQTADNPIPATRFFGPILPPTFTNSNTITTDTPSWSSMDPDSLELLPAVTTENQNRLASLTQSNGEKDQNVSSLTSHDYVKTKEVIYAHPKQVLVSLKPNCQEPNIYSNLSLNNQQNNIKLKEEIEKLEVSVRTIEINENFTPVISKSEELFIDSLEPLAEISTAF